MKILLDFTQIPVDRTGAGVYAENLIQELVHILSPTDVLFLLIHDDELLVPQFVDKVANVRVLTIPSRIFRNRAALIFYEQFLLPWLLSIKSIDVIHSLHYTHPFFSPAARVVTFHDLTFFLWPQLHTRARRTIMPIFIRLAWKRAESIIFVSASTRRDAEKLLPVSKSIRTVIPLGVKSDFFLRFRNDEIQDALQRLNIHHPYLLFLGTVEPRKNLIRLLHAFEKIAERQPDCILVIAGKLGWDYEPVIETIAASNFRERILHMGYVSETDKRVLLAGCIMLVYPSLYEGFGLPVLEAMAAGAPVITSKVSSLPEVAGEAAILIDPESVDQLASAMQLLLDEPVRLNKFKELGPERAKIFSWKKTATETYKAYQTAYQHRRRDR